MTTQQRRYDIFLKDSARRPVVLGGDGRTTTLRLFSARPVHMAEIPASVGFHDDGVVLLPTAPSGAGSALAVVAEVLRFAAEHPEHHLMVAAHGGDEARTAARARSALAVLTGDAAAFAEAAAAATGHDLQRVLAWAAGAFGFACDPGAVDGKVGPKTLGALRALRAALGAPGGSDPLRPDDWRLLLACYDRELGRLLGSEHDVAALRAGLKLVSTPAAGCGGEWPISRCRVEDLPCEADARVDLLAFAPADLPRLECHAGDACAPKKCDLYRKGKYRAAPIVASTMPAIVRGLLTGMFFDTDRAFLLPRAMAGIKRLKRYDELHPGDQLLVVGHTDTTGQPDYNLDLSDERAAAVAAYLRDDVDAWLAWYEARKESKRWGTREDQHMLSALPAGGPAFFTGEVDGKADAETKASIERFQAWSNDTRGTALAVDGIAGPKTRRELIGAYMDLDGATLPEGTVLLTHGCGEFHPDVATGDGVEAQENRRVEVFFFPEAVAPPPQGRCPAPGCPEYPIWRQLTALTIDLSLEPGLLEVLVTDADEKHALAEADVDLMGVDPRQGKTDASGRVRFDELFPGPYELTARRGGYQSAVAGVIVAPGATKAKTAPDEPVKTSSFVEAAPAPDTADTTDAPADTDPVHVPLEQLPPTITALRGPDAHDPVEAGADAYKGVKLAQTGVVAAVHREDAYHLQRDGLLPAPMEIVVLRVQPGAKADRSIRLTVQGRKGPLGKPVVVKDDAAPAGSAFDVKLALVWGEPPAGAPALALEGLQVVDVSDPQQDGTEDFARKLDVEGLGLPVQTLLVELRRPRIVKFVGFAVPPAAPRHESPKAAHPTKPVGPTTEVVVHLDWQVRLDWTVLGPFEALRLDPGAKALEAASKDPAAGTLTLDPAVHRPAETGTYTLTVRGKGGPLASAAVTAMGITRFALRGLDPARRLEEVDNFHFHPKTGDKLAKAVDVLPGRAGTWRDGPSITGLMLANRKPHLNVWFGQVLGTLEPDVLYEWSVIGPTDLQVQLDVHGRGDAARKAVPPSDVTQATWALGGHGSEEVRGRFVSSTMTYMEADLSLWRPGVPLQAGKRLTSALLRLRIDRPMPSIADGAEGFQLLDDTEAVGAGAAVRGWDGLHVRWRLTGDHMFNRYRLRIVPAGEEKKKEPTVLAEVDLKAKGTFTSAGDVKVPRPKDTAGHTAFVAVADLVRSPTGPEVAAGADPASWLPSANGARGRRELKFVIDEPGTFPCSDMRKRCPVNHALALRLKYIAALEHLAAVRKRYAERLSAAYFVKQVAERITDPKAKDPLDPSKVWPNMRGTSGADGTTATGYSDSYLRADIERMEREIQAAVDAAEAAARALIDYITSPAKKHDGRTFQEHLALPAHTEHVINEGNAQLAAQLYGVGAPASYDPGQAVYRHVDHLCALFTDYMSQTKIGRTFLESLFDEAQLKKDLLAFDAVWEWVGKVNNITEPVGKFIYNVSLVHQHELKAWTSAQLADYVHKKLIPNGQVRKFLDFLHAKVNAKGFRYNVQDVLYTRSFGLCLKNAALKEKVEAGKLTLADAEEYSKTKGGEAASKDGAWFNLAVDAMALMVAIQKAEADWKGERLKNTASVLKELFGTLKSAGELAEGTLLSRGATAAEVTGDAGRLATRAVNAGRAVKVCGVIAGVLGAVLSWADAYEGFKSKDWDRVTLHALAGVASLVAIVWPGVGALMAIAIALVMELVLDAPVVDWLEDTPWGEDQIYKDEEVIEKFYESLFDIGMYLKHRVSDDSNHDELVVVSSALNEQVEITVRVGKPGRTPATATFTLAQKDIAGKAVISWPHFTTEGKKRFHLGRAWEAFPTITRDGTDHEVTCELRPPEAKNAPLKITRTIEFRKPPLPQLEVVAGTLWGFAALEKAGRFKQRPGSRAADPWYVVVDPGQEQVPIVVPTRYARGCEVRLELWRPGLILSDRESFSILKVPLPPGGKPDPGRVETTFQLQLPVPPADDDIELRLEAAVYPPGVDAMQRPDDEVDGKHSMTFRVGRAAYVGAPA